MQGGQVRGGPPFRAESRAGADPQEGPSVLVQEAGLWRQGPGAAALARCVSRRSVLLFRTGENWSVGDSPARLSGPNVPSL